MKIKTIDETNWKSYLIKALQFQETARDAFHKHNWNAVGLNAVHSVISANDAITVYYKKIRSISDKHSDAANLLLEVLPKEKEVESISKHLSWLINRKNIIEYESRLFYQKEAEDALRHMDRFINWIQNKLDE